MIAQSRNLDCTQRGRDLHLGRGDATLLHVAEVGRVGSPRHFGYVCVMIPQSECETRGAHPDDTVMQRLPWRSEVLLLLRAYVRSLERGRLGDWMEGRETIRRHIFDLVLLAISSQGAMGESSVSAVCAARLAAILDHIAAHFNEPELSLAALAEAQGISPRYLHRLIETTGKSYTQHVNELRLQKAFTMLAEVRSRERRILIFRCS